MRSSKQPTAADAAALLLKEYSRMEYLDQGVAVHELREAFGEAFLYDNANGNPAISKAVLAAFNKLSGADVVWSRGDRVWRKRQPYDGPGRQQY